MPELVAILNAKQKKDYEDRKFFAALQGVDLDKNQSSGQEAWERIKAKAFSGGATENPNDILALQGHAANKAGFGIGLGLEAENIDADGNVTRIG